MRGKSWTLPEIAALRKNYPDKEKTMAALPERDWVSILCKAYKMKLSPFLKGKWTEKEDEVIRKNYLDKGKDLQKLLPHRTIDAIRSRAKKLGLGRRGEWTEKEMKILKQLYPTADKKRLCMMLPNHSFMSIKIRANKIGLVRLAKPVRKPSNKNAKKEAPYRPPGFIKVRPYTVVKAMPLPEPKVEKVKLKDDYGPYDPTTHCIECAFYTRRGRSEDSPTCYCNCWHVKGKDGGYKTVRSGSPACRYFMGKRTLGI